MHFGTANAEAGSEFFPADSAVRKYGEGFMFTDGGQITDADGKPSKTNGNGVISVSMPPHLGNYERINTGVKYEKELSPEVIKVGRTSVTCVVLDVLYDRRGWEPAEREVKYWIDADRFIVVQEQVATLQDADDTSIVWNWTYRIDSVKLNEPPPPPKWLINHELSRSQADHLITAWIGKEAPTFNLPDLDQTFQPRFPRPPNLFLIVIFYLFNDRHFLDTRSAPGRPEVQEHHLSAHR
jgi:hypothetical protein